MSDNPKTCGNCAYRSDTINVLSLDYCYCIDVTVDRDGAGCPEWRGSLRDEPLEGPEAQLVENVRMMDEGMED